MNSLNNMPRPAEILLVEDNEGDVLLTKAAFSEAKLQNNIEVAEDGEVALDYLHKRNGFESAVTPDLILLDLSMPKIGGLEVLEEIKATEALKRIPVVVMSSSEQERDIVMSYGLHANSYVVKPIELKTFTDIVAAVESFWFSVVVLPPKQ